MKLTLVCGQIASGKTTHSIEVAQNINAVRFSIDPWMQNLFGKDSTYLNFDWIMERVERCHKQIWEVSEQILNLGGSVVLDLGFSTEKQRYQFSDLAAKIGVIAELHFLKQPSDIRWERTLQRNQSKNPEVYSFDINRQMFEFMDAKFEQPNREETKKNEGL